MNKREINMAKYEQEAKNFLKTGKGHDLLQDIIYNYAAELNFTLTSDRENTCYTTSQRISEGLKRMGVKHDVVYAQQDGGYAHWFIRINVQSTITEPLLLDLTATQFGVDEFPMVCFNTHANLISKHGEQAFWNILATERETKTFKWKRAMGIE